MKKPEKKDYEKWLKDNIDCLGTQSHYFDGYNQACIDWEQYIKSRVPSVEEIEFQITENCDGAPSVGGTKEAAQSISTLIKEKMNNEKKKRDMGEVMGKRK